MVNEINEDSNDKLRETNTMKRSLIFFLSPFIYSSAIAIVLPFSALILARVDLDYPPSHMFLFYLVSEGNSYPSRTVVSIISSLLFPHIHIPKKSVDPGHSSCLSHLLLNLLPVLFSITSHLIIPQHHISVTKGYKSIIPQGNGFTFFTLLKLNFNCPHSLTSSNAAFPSLPSSNL